MKSEIYQFAGLRIASDLPLFGLQVCRDAPEGRCEVVIRRAPVSDEVAGVTARFLNGRYSGIYNGKEVLLEYSELGRFLIRSGEEIIVDLAASSDAGAVRAYLLGAVFGALCHQRGITPLHAAAIDVADSCVTFVGASGAGKSTLVAGLAQHGYEIIADDECFMQLGPNGSLHVWPGISRIRLWKDAGMALGFDPPRVEGRSRSQNKYFVPVRSPRNPIDARSLRRVYQLDPVPNGPVQVVRLCGGEAVEALMQNVYPPGVAALLGYQSNVFTVCAKVACEVPVFRLSRPRDLAALDQSIQLLESHLQDIA